MDNDDDVEARTDGAVCPVCGADTAREMCPHLLEFPGYSWELSGDAGPDGPVYEQLFGLLWQISELASQYCESKRDFKKIHALLPKHLMSCIECGLESDDWLSLSELQRYVEHVIFSLPGFVKCTGYVSDSIASDDVGCFWFKDAKLAMRRLDRALMPDAKALRSALETLSNWYLTDEAEA